MSRLSKLGFIDTQRTKTPVRRRIRSRGVPTALMGHEVFCTDHQAEASELVGKFLGRNHLTVHGNVDEMFQAVMHAIRLRDVTMGYLDFHVATTLEIPNTADVYTVHMPTNGTADCRYNGTTFTSTTYHAIVASPGTHLTMRFEFDSPQLIMRIERAALESQLARMLGRAVDRPLVFEPLLDLTTDPAVRWHGAIQLLFTEVLTPRSLVQQGLGGGPIEELIISTLLLIQPSNYQSDLTRAAARHGRRSVRRSISYIEEHLARPITMTDIAKHTHMSVRSIQQGFREDLGTTPMSYIRDRRLEQVRAQLADSIPNDGVTVTDIAERWGFSHLGNFSVAYRRRFGETPSQTFRR